MNKGIRMDLNTHNITKLATQLARFNNRPPDDFIKDLYNISQILSSSGQKYGSTDRLDEVSRGETGNSG